jgi:membrane associated rhomboid family serine protease
MVDPISNEDRERTMVRMKVGSVLLVGASAGLITLQGDASIEVALAAIVGGLILGALLVWYLFPDATELAPGSDREYRR